MNLGEYGEKARQYQDYVTHFMIYPSGSEYIELRRSLINEMPGLVALCSGTKPFMPKRLAEGADLPCGEDWRANVGT